MEVIKSKRTAKCYICYKPIELKYRVKEGNKNYHLSCYFRWISGRYQHFKDIMKTFNKLKYKKQMLLEGLE